MTQRNRFQAVCGAGNAVAATVLCVLMASPQWLWAEEPMKGTLPVPVHQGALTSQEKTLHALNRLTFGPRPGDEAAVSKMGLEAWFQGQLRPESIDDAGLAAKLDMFPAMRLSQAELLQRFPSPQRLKGMQRRGDALPSDPVEHAIYADAMAAYDAFLNQQGGKAADAAKANMAGADAGMGAGVASSPTHDDGTVMNGPPSMGAGSTKAPDVAGKKGRMKSVVATDAEDLEAIEAMTPDQRMQLLVKMSPEEMLSLRKAVRGAEVGGLMRGLTPAQVEVVAAMQAPGRLVGAEALESRLVRDVYSQRQLQAVMTDFWLNHFSVYVKKNQNEPYLLPGYERDVVLPNALGNFEQLLVATAKSPAMLVYLDNWESVGPDSVAAKRIGQAQKARPNGELLQKLPKGINENYARELMELHTLGVGGGYTQKDVIEVAKCFTGWTIDRNYQSGGGTDEFVFQENRHEGGDKVVLGHTIHEDGMNEGLEVLHILATSPATAKFIATKLAVRFVSDTPPAALVDRMAATFLKSNGDIKAVLTTMFHAPEFWSPEVYRAKVKTPVEFLVSALRASDATVKNPLPLVQAMERLGMPVYGMQTPNGYSWMANEWVSSNALVSRMNFALVLSGNRVPGTMIDWPGVLGGSVDAAAPTAGTERELEGLILGVGQTANARTRETVLAQFNNPTALTQAEQGFAATKVSSDDEDAMAGGMMLRAKAAKKDKEPAYGQRPVTPLDTMAGLLLGSPDFQRR